MDFLNQSFAQVRDLFLSMTPGARLTAGLLLAVVGISAGFLFTHESSKPDDYLFGGLYLTAEEADRVDAAIAKAGLNGAAREGNRVRVPSGRRSEYLAAVAASDALPRNFHSIIEKAVESGPFIGNEQTRQRVKLAKEQQLSIMLRQLDWVENALVMFDVDKVRAARSPFGQKRGSATVTVTPVAGESVNPRRMKTLRNLVAGAFVALEAKDVTVVDAFADTVVGGGGSDSMLVDILDDPYYKRRITYENYVRDQIHDMLSYIPGVRVQVSAELDTTLEKKMRSVTPDDAASATLREKKLETEETRSKAQLTGRPGLVANGPNRQAATPAPPVPPDRSQTTSKDTDIFVAATEEVQTLNGLTPTKVKATIAIPQSYLVQVWRQDNMPADGSDPGTPDASQLKMYRENEITRVEESVVQLLPSVSKEDPYSQVKVTTIRELAKPQLAPPSTAENALAWAQRYWNTLAMAVLAVFSLFMLRSMVKSVPQSPPGRAAGATDDGPTLSVERESASAGEEDDEEESEGNRPKLRLKKGPTLKDDLVEIVREDPDSAAAILKSWISAA